MSLSAHVVREIVGGTRTRTPVFAVGTQVSDATVPSPCPRQSGAEPFGGGVRFCALSSRAQPLSAPQDVLRTFRGAIGGKMILIDGNYRQAATVTAMLWTRPLFVARVGA